MNRTPGRAPSVVFFLGLATILSGCGLRFSAARIPTLTSQGGSSLAASLSPRAERPSERDCLLVLLPGIGDSAESFQQNEFVSEAHARAPECDLILVDAHLVYYLEGSVETRLAVDVLSDGLRYGYRSVWLVGISLGGYGAVMTARAHPELVDGVVLIAPMLGMPPREDDAAAEIEAAGGLLAWDGEVNSDPRHHFSEPRLVWEWLRDSARGSHAPTVLAYGREDRLAPRHLLLADAISPDRVFSTAGDHDWATWRQLWTKVLDSRPWAG